MIATTIASTTPALKPITVQPAAPITEPTTEPTTEFTTFPDSDDDRGIPNWSEWSPFSVCSATCGGGTKIKSRVCSIEGSCPGSATKKGFLFQTVFQTINCSLAQSIESCQTRSRQYLAIRIYVVLPEETEMEADVFLILGIAI